MSSSPEAAFSDPRLAALYDLFENGRDDLESYVAMALEFGAFSVLDVGCGTGELVCRLAARGIDAVGVDPAAASLAVARSKARRMGVVDRVTWVEGSATALAGALTDVLPPRPFDLAVMTGNVAQVFVADDEWAEALSSIGHALGPRGRLIFEARRPEIRAWETWTPERTRTQTTLPSGETVETWCELLDVVEHPVTVSFRWIYVFRSPPELRRSGSGSAPDVLTSDSTLRFRSHEEIASSLVRAGFGVVDVRDAPDRPGREMVFVARRLEQRS